MDLYEPIIRSLINEGLSYREVSNFLVGFTGHYEGLSQRSVRRFCRRRGIRSRRRGGLDDTTLDEITGYFINRVGHSYGRRTMHGLLASRGLTACQLRVGRSLNWLAPLQYAQRRHDVHRMLNPPPYRAYYYGEKLHLDQNEKCCMYGATHVLAIDGFSGKIVGFVTIPKKNAVLVYDLLFRPLPLLASCYSHHTEHHPIIFLYYKVCRVKIIKLNEYGLRLINGLIILSSGFWLTWRAVEKSQWEMILLNSVYLGLQFV